jgi:hypothetical protein
MRAKIFKKERNFYVIFTTVIKNGAFILWTQASHHSQLLPINLYPLLLVYCYSMASFEDDAEFDNLDAYVSDSEDTTDTSAVDSKQALAKAEYVPLLRYWSLERSNVTCRDSHVGFHSAGFKDFLLKPELIRAIVDGGFEVRNTEE